MDTLRGGVPGWREERLLRAGSAAGRGRRGCDVRSLWRQTECSGSSWGSCWRHLTGLSAASCPGDWQTSEETGHPPGGSRRGPGRGCCLWRQ